MAVSPKQQGNLTLSRHLASPRFPSPSDDDRDQPRGTYHASPSEPRAPMLSRAFRSRRTSPYGRTYSQNSGVRPRRSTG